MDIQPQLQKLLDRSVPKQEQGRFVDAAIRKALAELQTKPKNPKTTTATATAVEIYVDGGSRGNPGPSGGGYVAFRKGKELFRGSEFFGIRTNNQAEYLALRAALRDAYADCGDCDLMLYMDSQLMAEQLKGNYKVKNAGLKPIYEEVMRTLEQFKSFHVKHIPREENSIADAMANEAMDRRT